MSLLAPAFLLLCGLLLVVLALHTQQHRAITMPSVQIWQRLQRPAASRKRVWRLPRLTPLLLLQLAAVLLATLALAQPLLGALGSREHWVFVLDGSASMRATQGDASRFDLARDRVAALIAHTDPQNLPRYSIVAAGPEAHIIAARLENRPGALGDRMAGLAAGDDAADWTGATRLLSQVVRENEPTRIVLVTDGTEPQAATIAQAFPAATATQIRIGTPQPNATLIGTLAPNPNDPDELELDASAQLSGGATQTRLLVEFRGEGTTTPLDWQQRELTLRQGVPPPQGTEVAALNADADLELPGPGVVRASLAPDANPFDNALYFITGTPDPEFAVLYLGQGTSPVLRALQGVEGAAIYQAQALPAETAAYDLVVVDNLDVPSPPQTNVLWLGAATLAGSPAPTLVELAEPTAWDSAHPLSRGVDWAQLTTAAAHGLPTAADETVLLEASGTPLVTAGTTPAGRSVHVGLSLDAGGWAAQPSFPVFVANLVTWLGPRPSGVVRPPCVVATPCAIDARLIGANVLVEDYATGNRTPAGPQAWFDADGALMVERAGLYRLERGDRVLLLAVNPGDYTQSNLAAVPPGLPLAEQSGPDALHRLWPYLAGALALVLLVEAVLAGRGPERFLQAGALNRSNPLAGRRRIMLALRVLTLGLVVASLLDAPVALPTRTQNLVAVATPAGLEALAARNDAHSLAGHDVGIVALGGPGALVKDLGDASVLPAPDGPADLESGLALAAAALPADRPGRILLATEAAGTADLGPPAVPGLVARGLAVDAVPVTGSTDPDAALVGLSAPGQVYVEDGFTLTGIVASQTSGPATLEIIRDGETIATQSVNLSAGDTVVQTLIPEAGPGAVLYEMAIAAPQDTVPQNDRSGLVVTARQPASVGIFTQNLEQGELFAQILASQDIAASVTHVSRAPMQLQGWLEHDAIVLMNVPAIALATRQQQAIETAVSEHGRGLLILGGENSFGPGGYLETPLDRLSPISSRVPREAPEVALAFVLDRSGSMNQQVGEVTRLDIAKEAARAAIDLLGRDSQVSLVVFDSEARVVLPMQSVAARDEIATALASIDSGGGTAIYPGLVEGLAQLRSVASSARHMVVMTDGLSQPGDFDGLLDQIVAEGITVSTVAIGEGADGTALQRIAARGDGAFHATRDFQALPSILSQEAMLLSGTPVEEGITQPRWTGPATTLTAGLPATMPPISGFVLATAKPEADLLLVAPDQRGETMPILANWRYGNGQVLALTTQGAGAWTRDWLSLPQYAHLWSQAVRQFRPSVQAGGLDLSVQRAGDMLTARLDARDPTGAPRTGLKPELEITAPDGTSLDPMVLREIGPGRYQARLLAEASGTYGFATRLDEETATALHHVAYPARFAHAKPDATGATLAQLTGGRTLGAQAPLLPETPLRWEAMGGWQVWLVAALVAFMIELLVRYGNILGMLVPGRRRANRLPAGRHKSRSAKPSATTANRVAEHA